MVIGTDVSAPRVLVIIPTYNECDNLPRLVPAVLAHGYRVMIVDDDSPDGTGQVADALAREFPKRVQVMHRRGPRGLGRAYIEAFATAVGTDADLVCHMDADLSHDPKYLPDLVAAADRFDVVVGSRYLDGVSVVNWPLYRIALSSLANRYIRLVTRMPTRDCTSGFRCWRREALRKLPLDRLASDGYAFLVETLFEAFRRGGVVGETPIVFVERRHGRSKVSAGVLLESLMIPWVLSLRRLTQHRVGSPDSCDG